MPEDAVVFDAGGVTASVNSCEFTAHLEVGITTVVYFLLIGEQEVDMHGFVELLNVCDILEVCTPRML